MQKYSMYQIHFVPFKKSRCFLCFVDSKLGAAEVWTSRQALQDLYQKMLVTDLEYALDKKVEQDLYAESNDILSIYNNYTLYSYALSVITLTYFPNSVVLFSWNHAFKNQITTLQSQAKNRANPNRSEVQANLSLFLEAASGFYTQVSWRYGFCNDANNKKLMRKKETFSYFVAKFNWV